MQNRLLKGFFRLTLGMAGLAVAAGVVAEMRARRAPPSWMPAVPDGGDLDAHARRLGRGLVQYFVIPVWTAAGVADWWCHRRSDIAHTTGVKESLMHLLMLGEAGFPLMAGLLLEVNPPLLSGMIASFFLHEATAMWDVSYAVTRREVHPIEQHVHSFLEMMPLLGIVLLVLLHWPEFSALAGSRIAPPSRLRYKRYPLSRSYVVGVTASLLFLEMLPYCEELLRDLAAERDQRAALSLR
jgi:hypothetical protein